MIYHLLKGNQGDRLFNGQVVSGKVW